MNGNGGNMKGGGIPKPAICSAAFDTPGWAACDTEAFITRLGIGIFQLLGEH